MSLKLFRRVLRLLRIQFLETACYITISHPSCGILRISKYTECGTSSSGLTTITYGDAAMRLGLTQVFDLNVGQSLAANF